MMQSRTHTCGQLRIENVGEKVRLVGWMENVREVGGSLAFVVLRDFYGTTQIVVEDETVGENTVVEVLQQGFLLGERVLRFAIVKVAN